MAGKDDNKYGWDFTVWNGDKNKAGSEGEAEKPREVKKRPQDPPLPPAQPKPKELKFIKGEFKPGSVAGYKLNQKCMVTGTADWQDNARVSKIDTKLFITVPSNPEEDMHSPGSGTIEKDGSFTAEVTLYCASAYQVAPNREKFVDAVKYRVEISHPNHIEPLSVTIDFPLAGDIELPILKRGHYDEKGNGKYPDKCPKDGANFLTGTPVFDWQNFLIETRYLPPNSADGAFGDATEKATKQFQKDATLKKRLGQKTQTFEEVPSITYQGTDDGIVGPKSRDEMGIWKRKNWIQPILEIHSDHFDEAHVSAGKGMRNDSNFVEKSAVADLQKKMQAVGAYQSYSIDGWAGPKWKESLEEIQAAAKKGEWMLDGKLVTIPYKLADYRPGVAGVEDQKIIQHAIDEKLTIPPAAGTLYGGYILQENDKDATKTWGGKQQSTAGAFVKELQEDLLKLGYWISNPADAVHKGMNADGEVGPSMIKAVKTAQFELLVLDASGNIDMANINKITGKVNIETAKAIKKRINGLGAKTWDRPGHQPFTMWEEPAQTGDYDPNKTTSEALDGKLFYQLPPSSGYYRTSPDFGSRAIKSKGTKYRCKPFKIFDNTDAEWLMADCWGTKEQIDTLKSVGDKWLKTADKKDRIVKTSDGKEHIVKPFCIGDLSAFNGGALAPHAGHRSGNEADLNKADGTSICSTEVFASDVDRELSLELCKQLAAANVKNIYFNCHYVIANVAKSQFCDGHSNHVHFDGPKSSARTPDANEKSTTCHGCALFSNCEHRIFKVRGLVTEPWTTAKDYKQSEIYSDKRYPGVQKFKDASGQPFVLTKEEWKALRK